MVSPRYFLQVRISNTTHLFRYLHELGDYEVSGHILDTSLAACENKNSLLYSDLRNTAGSRYYALNKLGDCRKVWDETLTIRKSFLAPNSPGGE
jgi:hypothetical protein